MTKEPVEKVLKDAFVDAFVDLGPVGQTGRVSGVVVSDEFQELDYRERQALVWDALKSGLQDDIVNISTIIAFTKDEYNDMLPESSTG